MHSEEFKKVLLPLWPFMYRFARSLLGDKQEAEDCVQETFLKLLALKTSLNDIKNVRAFSMQMTRNLCLDKIKERKRVILDVTRQRIEADINLHLEIENQDLVMRVEEILRLIPEQQRSLIHLRNIEGLEMKEIAEITGLSVEHARVTLSRARMAIRELYQKYYDNE